MGRSYDKRKLRLIAQEYVKQGYRDMTEAVNKIEKYPNVQKCSQYNKAYRMKKSAEYQEQLYQTIKEKLKNFDKGIITPELVLYNLLEMSRDERAKHSDRIRANELLGKYLNLFKESGQTQNIAIFNTEMQELLNKRLPKDRITQKPATNEA